MRIRKSDDLELIEQLHKEIFPNDLFDEVSRNHFWIAWDGSHPVGFCSIRTIKTDESTAFLTRAGVRRCFRGKGLQKRFIDVRVRWARQNNIKKIITYTWHDNAASFANLQARGFKLYLPAYYWAGSKVLYWMREL